MDKFKEILEKLDILIASKDAAAALDQMEKLARSK